MYHIILFDLDGTISDPGIGITNSVAYALEKFNIKVKERSELYKFIGPPLQDSFAQFYGFNEKECENAITYYREYFKERGLYENELYDGMETLLKDIRNAGKKVILATSKPEKFAVEILKYFKIEQYFDTIAGATMDGSRSKKADVIAYALKESGIEDLSSTVMVGDREHDILGAKEIGIASIGVLYGYGDREELQKAGAKHIVETVGELRDLLLPKN